MTQNIKTAALILLTQRQLFYLLMCNVILKQLRNFRFQNKICDLRHIFPDCAYVIAMLSLIMECVLQNRVYFNFSVTFRKVISLFVFKQTFNCLV